MSNTYYTRSGHVHLKVRDLERAIDFYTRFFSLKVIERIGNFAFLSSSHMHHEVALQALGVGARQPSPNAIGLYHIAFEVPDQRSLAVACQSLTEAGVQVDLVDHLISWAIYFSDPDGNGLEIYWDTRGEPEGDYLWQGRNLPLAENQLLSILREVS